MPSLCHCCQTFFKQDLLIPDFFNGLAIEAEELLRQGGDPGDRDGRAAHDHRRQAQGRGFPADGHQRPAHGAGLRHHEQIPEQILGACE